LRLVAGRLQGVRDVRRDLLDCLHVDERPDHRTGSNSSTTFIAPAVSARLAERVIDTVLHQDAVDAETSPVKG
jgi:hypothetical protein